MAQKKISGAADLFPAGGSARFTHKISKLHPLHNNVLVRDMSFESRKLQSGILLLGDDGKTDGIRARWARVYAVGPDQKTITPGQWVMIEHGRWSRGLEVEIGEDKFTLRRVDPECIMFTSDEEPDSIDTLSNSVHAHRNQR
jgi:co-chaperonin GroES (HSP10)